MLNKLRGASEIAVDLEHHSYRTYLGFLCLMQISTRDEDFVVDVIALRDEMEVLNEVLTDPKILKVFHGAESDIVWLQQDFNLYVVNLFDTFHASKLLGELFAIASCGRVTDFSCDRISSPWPRQFIRNVLRLHPRQTLSTRGLAYSVCNDSPLPRTAVYFLFVRPLPDEMLEYARSDTHFLLFIYDNLRNALVDRGTTSRSRSSSPPNASTSSSTLTAHPLRTPPSTAHASQNPSHAMINHVLARSSDTCLRVYTKEVYDRSSGTGSNGWDTLAKKWNKPMFTASCSQFPPDESNHSVSQMQKAVYRTVHWWRESVSREEDESTRYILPNQYLFRIAETPPGDLGNLLRLFGNSVPAVVKRRAKELLDVVRDVVKSSLGGSDGFGEKVKKEDRIREDGDADKKEDEKVEHVGNLEVKDRSGETNEKLWGESSELSFSSHMSNHIIGTDETNEMLKASSSLFSKKTASFATTASTYATVRSTLFGNIVNTSIAKEQNSHFQELVAKINSTLVIMPSISKVCPLNFFALSSMSSYVSKTVASKEEVEKDVEEETGMQVEIPFVPAAQRQAASVIEEKERDTIVVVGKPKTKKRKRTKSTTASSSQVLDKEIVAEDGKEDEEDFDFASVPNVLDENPQVEAKKPVKKKQKKKKGMSDGSILWLDCLLMSRSRRADDGPFSCAAEGI